LTTQVASGDEPVFDVQTGNVLKVLGVMRHQREVVNHSRGGDLQIDRISRKALPLEDSAEACRCGASLHEAIDLIKLLRVLLEREL